MASQKDLEQIRKKVSVLKDSKSTEEKAKAANSLGVLLHDSDSGAAVASAVAAEGALPPLVQLLRDGSAEAKRHAAFALWHLAKDEEVAKAMVACGARESLEALVKTEAIGEDKMVKNARSYARFALERLPPKASPEVQMRVEPETRTAGTVAETTEVLAMGARQGALLALLEAEPSGEVSSPNQVQVEVKFLKSETSTSDEQCKAAEQLGNWAAASDEKRGEINKAGGCEALVALVVTGSDDAKWHAARALRNLANHAEAKESILKADGIAVLTPLAKHGKGKVKEAASEALNLLSLVDGKAKPAPAADTKPAESAAAAATDIPSGEGTRVAMFSARFDGGPMEQKFRKVFSILRDHKYDVLMVAADAGESFADLTTEYLGRLQEEQGTMLAVCTRHYGEMTASAYSSHKELKFALDYEQDVKFLPLKVEDTYPPQPAGGPEHTYDKKGMAKKYILSVFKPGLVYLDCQDKSERDIAANIAKVLSKYRVKG